MPPKRTWNETRNCELLEMMLTEGSQDKALRNGKWTHFRRDRRSCYQRKELVIRHSPDKSKGLKQDLQE